MQGRREQEKGAGRIISTVWAQPVALDAIKRGSWGKHNSGSCRSGVIHLAGKRKFQEAGVHVPEAS